MEVSAASRMVDESRLPPKTKALLNGESNKSDNNPQQLGRETVVAAIAEMKAGRPVVVTDDADRENEGDLIFAAESATSQTLAFVVRHTSGVICVAMRGERLDELRLPAMVEKNQDPKGTAFTVSVDLKEGVTTGISAADRARTIRAMADPSQGPGEFCRPGHIFPLRARPGGVLERGGHTEAAVDLAELAGLYPAGGLCEIVRDEDGEMSRGEDLEIFRKKYNLVATTIEDIRAYRRELAAIEGKPAFTADHRVAITRVGKTKIRLPTRHGVFEAICFVEPGSSIEHIALLRGFELAPNGTMTESTSDGKETTSAATTKNEAVPVDERNGGLAEPPLVRVHSECATGDIFGSRRCDCGEQLERSMVEIAKQDKGVLLYIRGHEGRGIGLGAKLEAYALQDQGRDTVEANLDLGLPVDARSYDAAAAMLRDLGVREVRLMTNNPKKCDALRAGGVAVSERIPIQSVPNEDNIQYLRVKQRKMGHLLNLQDYEAEEEESSSSSTASQ